MEAANRGAHEAGRPSVEKSKGSTLLQVSFEALFECHDDAMMGLVGRLDLSELRLVFLPDPPVPLGLEGGLWSRDFQRENISAAGDTTLGFGASRPEQLDLAELCVVRPR